MGYVAIIDDSMVVRKIVETILSRAGIRCLCFRDGYEAMCAFNRELAQIPDLLFLDINLPRIDGYDLLKVFKGNSRFEGMTIVMLTSRDGVLDRVKCRLAGARGFLAKPFRTQELLAIVATHLATSRLDADTSSLYEPFPSNYAVAGGADSGEFYEKKIRRLV
jgi:twitching motility two-component system response regulator PilG